MNNENKKTEEFEDGVFYGKLPVSAPVPIERPSKVIQLPPAVQPVAIVPYVDFSASENEADNKVRADSQYELSDAEAAALVEAAAPKKGRARAAAVIMLIASLLAVFPFVVSLLNTFPIPSLEKYIKVDNLITSFKTLFQTKNFTDWNSYLSLYLTSIALLLVVINFLKSVVSLISGKRVGYLASAIFAFLLFVVAALYNFGFGNIKDIGNITKYTDGWAYLTTMLCGFANLLFAIIAAIVSPKPKNVLFDD